MALSAQAEADEARRLQLRKAAEEQMIRSAASVGAGEREHKEGGHHNQQQHHSALEIDGNGRRTSNAQGNGNARPEGVREPAKKKSLFSWNKKSSSKPKPVRAAF